MVLQGLKGGTAHGAADVRQSHVAGVGIVFVAVHTRLLMPCCSILYLIRRAAMGIVVLGRGSVAGREASHRGCRGVRLSNML